MLGYAGLDYLKASMFVMEHHETLAPLFNFILPTMHQTLELLTKAIALKVDAGFEPKRFSHKLRDLVRNYKNRFGFLRQC